MRNIRELFDEAINSIKLNILVFGPQVSDISDDERTKNLQLKRIQIKEELTNEGHNVKYAEDEVDPSLGAIILQEELIMREFDMIINLVGTPGAIFEAGLIVGKPQIARKAQFFVDAEHHTGLVFQSCRDAEDLGAYFQEYQYPQDLVDCNLLGYIKSRVLSFQKTRYYLT